MAITYIKVTGNRSQEILRIKKAQLSGVTKIVFHLLALVILYDSEITNEEEILIELRKKYSGIRFEFLKESLRNQICLDEILQEDNEQKKSVRENCRVKEVEVTKKKSKKQEQEDKKKKKKKKHGKEDTKGKAEEERVKKEEEKKKREMEEEKKRKEEEEERIKKEEEEKKREMEEEKKRKEEEEREMKRKKREEEREKKKEMRRLKLEEEKKKQEEEEKKKKSQEEEEKKKRRLEAQAERRKKLEMDREFQKHLDEMRKLSRVERKFRNRKRNIMRKKLHKTMKMPQEKTKKRSKRRNRKETKNISRNGKRAKKIIMTNMLEIERKQNEKKLRKAIKFVTLSYFQSTVTVEEKNKAEMIMDEIKNEEKQEGANVTPTNGDIANREKKTKKRSEFRPRSIINVTDEEAEKRKERKRQLMLEKMMKKKQEEEERKKLLEEKRIRKLEEEKRKREEEEERQRKEHEEREIARRAKNAERRRRKKEARKLVVFTSSTNTNSLFDMETHWGTKVLIRRFLEKKENIKLNPLIKLSFSKEVHSRKVLGDQCMILWVDRIIERNNGSAAVLRNFFNYVNNLNDLRRRTRIFLKLSSFGVRTENDTFVNNPRRICIEYSPKNTVTLERNEEQAQLKFPSVFAASMRIGYGMGGLRQAIIICLMGNENEGNEFYGPYTAGCVSIEQCEQKISEEITLMHLNFHLEYTIEKKPKIEKEEKENLPVCTVEELIAEIDRKKAEKRAKIRARKREKKLAKKDPLNYGREKEEKKKEEKKKEKKKEKKEEKQEEKIKGVRQIYITIPIFQNWEAFRNFMSGV